MIYHIKQVEKIVNETKKTIAGLIILSMIVIYAFVDFIPIEFVYIWIFLQSIFVGLRTHNAKKLKSYIDSKNYKKITLHINLLSFYVGYSAIVWNIAIIGGAIYSPEFYEMFSLVLMVGIIAAASLSLSAIFKVYITYYLVLVVPFILFMASFSDDIHRVILLLMFAYLPYMLMLSKSINKNIWTTINDNLKLQESEVLLKKGSIELHAAKDKAEKSQRIKTKFLANMSHEIRTPMNGIIGMTHLALQTNLNEKQKNYINNIDSSARSLLDIINDILDFSKIEAGKLEINNIDFSLKKLLEDISNIVKFKADEKDLNFTINYDENMNNYFYGDSLRISQILINLISNAIKFTENGSVKLNISYGKIDNIYRFEIIDTGIGISQENQNKLFQSFSQADESTTREYGGTGLGLSISKQLVELMGGKIWVESKVGVGSKFIFEINLIGSDKAKIEKKEPIEINQIKTLKGSQILLVEDSLINQEIIIGLLENSGISIDIASNGEIALDMFESGKYELILMDIQMPVMDGYEATRRIRGIDKDIPIVALTANARIEDAQKTKIAGMSEHLNKPIDIEKLYETLLKYISKKIEVKDVEGTICSNNNIIIPKFINIDANEGLLHLAGNKKLYMKVIKNFYYSYNNLKIENLEEDEFKRATHTIKGLSANMGAKSLHRIAQILDDSQDRTLIASFNAELKKVLDELKNIASEEISDIKDKKEISKTQKDELFEKLKVAAKTKRPKNFKSIIEDLDSYILLEEEKSIFEKVKILIKKYKFKEALTVLGER